jgi:hypothetical protein
MFSVSTAFCLVALPARAADASADELFADATALIEQQRYADAIPKLEEAQRRDPGVGTQFNLAVCYEMTGRLALAYRNFSQVESMARAAGKTEREQAAHDELASLRPRVSFVAIKIEEAGPVVIRVDGEIVSSADLAFVPLDAGEHHVEAIGASKRPFDARFTIAGEAERHEIVVPALEAIVDSAPPPPPDARPAPQATSSGSARRTASYILGGVGVAGLAVATVSGIIIISDKTIANRECPNGSCTTTEGANAAREGANLFPVNWVGWGAAAIGLGAGAYLFLTSSDSTQRRSSRGAIVPMFDAHGGGAALIQRF